jgi:ATP-dependent protease ClpP protease subunit
MTKLFKIVVACAFFTSLTMPIHAQSSQQVPVPKCEVRFMSAVTDESLNKLLDEINRPDICSDSKQLLKVYIQSGGGSVEPMIFTYMQLRKRGNVETRIDYNSASAAVLLFLAGDVRVMKAGSYLLVHRVSQYLELSVDEKTDFDEAKEGFRRSYEDYAKILAERTKLSVKDAEDMMHKRTYLTAEEALQLGFATKIEP